MLTQGAALAPTIVSTMCAKLAVRLPDVEYWSGGRDISLELIRQSLTSIETAEMTTGLIESTLRTARPKNPWIEDASLVSLLCGLPGSPGDRFIRLLFERVSPAELATGQDRWRILSSITAEMIRVNDLSNRLSIVLKEAKDVAGRHRRNGLGAWATLVSCIVKKMYSSGHGLLEADVRSALSFLDLPAFAQELDRVPLGKQRSATGSTNERLALEAVQEWHCAVLRGLKSSPGAVLDQAAIPALLRIRERQWDFERVTELLGGLKEVEIAYRHPQALLGCLEVCIAHQDLDGITTLLESGIPFGAKTMDDVAHSFVSEALRLFWRAEEFDLAAICLTAISERSRQRGCEDTLNALDAALNAAADRVRQQFPGTPRLLLQRTGKDAAI